MKIFDPEGPLMSALAKLSDVVFCNIMFCVCSLPIITIGAALSALYDCTMSIVEDLEKPSMFRQFWTSFRKHLKQGTLLWLICLGILLILAAYAAAVNTLSGTMGTVYKVFFLLLAILFWAGFQYVFPVQANFDLRVRDVLKTAWLLSAAALPWTLLAMAITGLAVYMALFMGPTAINTAVFLWAVIGFCLVAYLQSFCFRQSFRRYKRMLGQEEPAIEPDPWDLEDTDDEAGS